MKVSAINTLNSRQSFGQPLIETKKKNTFLEKFHTATKNSADMTDTIVVPRTIFKGYLGIMVGTTLLTVGNLLNKSKFSKAVSLAGLATSLYGTYAFVRPFIIKDVKGVEKTIEK